MACGILVSRAGMEPMSPALEGRLLTGSPGKSLESLFNLWLSYPTLVVAQFSRICRLNLGPALKTVPTLPNPLTVLLLWRKEETQTLNPFTPLDVSYLSLKAGFCFSTGDKSIIYIYVCVYVCVCIYIYESHSVVSDSLWPHGLYSPWNSPDQNTRMCNLSLLQGIFPTQGLNPHFPHCSWILYQLSHHGSPRILEWVAYPFSRGSSWPKNRTGVFCIAGRFFTSWAIRRRKVEKR